MEKELMKFAIGLAVMALVAYMVAKHVVSAAHVDRGQERASRNWQRPSVVRAMADDAFVNNGK